MMDLYKFESVVRWKWMWKKLK